MGGRVPGLPQRCMAEWPPHVIAISGPRTSLQYPLRLVLLPCRSKTHTMMGPEEDPGLSVRALQALFDITAAEAEGGHRRTISVRWATVV